MSERDEWLAMARQQRLEMIGEWQRAGAPGDFYAWLLERVEQSMREHRAKISLDI